jgi:5-oxoprolinase (ATP-hydrolysing) subunit C
MSLLPQVGDAAPKQEPAAPTAGSGTPTLLILSCGPATSLQDLGRFGFQRQGISPSGAMDRHALQLANALAGNPPAVAAIEFAQLGGELACEGGPIQVGFCGAAMPLSIDGASQPAHVSITLWPGQVLRVAAARTGVFGYLAVAGGFAVEPQLGSLSLHRRSRIGGLEGRACRAGDRLALRRSAPAGCEMVLTAPMPERAGPIRVVLGPQDDHISASGLATFLSQPYVISARSDRMAYRLEGPGIAHAKGYNIVSDGIVTGSIQIPGSGEPLVLLADRQTTGGYPKVATIITADLPRFVQMRAGSTVRFAAIGIGEAVAVARATASDLAVAMASIQSLPEDWRESGWLLSHNLVDGVSDGGE